MCKGMDGAGMNGLSGNCLAFRVSVFSHNRFAVLLIRPDFMRTLSSGCPHVNLHNSAIKNNLVPAVRINIRPSDM